MYASVREIEALIEMFNKGAVMGIFTKSDVLTAERVFQKLMDEARGRELEAAVEEAAPPPPTRLHAMPNGNNDAEDDGA